MNEFLILLGLLLTATGTHSLRIEWRDLIFTKVSEISEKNAALVNPLQLPELRPGDNGFRGACYFVCAMR